MADGLLNKASIILTPTGYKAGTLYNVAPVVEPYEDFDFARASVASRVNSSGLVEMVGRTLGSELVQNGDFSQLGSELVVNGDWYSHRGAYFEITNDLIYIENDGNTYGGIEQSFSVSSGKNFQLKYTAIEGTTSTDWRVNIGSSQGGTDLYSKGQITDFTENTIITSTSTEIWIRIYNNTPTIGDNFSIDNVSVKQVDPNDYWTLGTGWSIADGVASCDGTQTGNSSLSQSSALPSASGKTYKITFTISNYVSGSVQVYPTNTTVGTYPKEDANGTYTKYVKVTSATPNDILYIQANSTFIGSVSNVSVKEIIDTNNIPRINYDGNGDNGHILLEPTSTNLVTYSEDFTQWTKSNASIINVIATTVISPDGVSFANKLYPIGTGSSSYIYQNAAAECFSIFVKKGERRWFLIYGGFANSNVWFDSENGVLGTVRAEATATVESFSNDWYRIKIIWTQNSTQVRLYNTDDDNTLVSTANNTDGLYIWGAQAEALSYATSYIPTLTGSTVTRATETATGAGSADLINSTEGVLYAEIAALVDDGTVRAIYISNGTTSNRLWIEFDSSSNRFEARYISGGVTSANFFHTVTNTTDYNKIAFKWKVNDFALWINGVEVATDTSGGVIAANTLNRIDFHNQANSSVQNFYGKVKALAVFNEALSDSELTQLTS